jgi:hypothetical protein
MKIRTQGKVDFLVLRSQSRKLAYNCSDTIHQYYTVTYEHTNIKTLQITKERFEKAVKKYTDDGRVYSGYTV